MLLTLVSLSIVPADARACDKDTDCKGDRICRSGECVAPGAPQKCVKDMDCPGEEVCTSGACGSSGAAEPAATPAPAPAPAPVPALNAAPSSVPEGRCASALDCHAGDVCEKSVCLPPRERRNGGLMVAGIVLLPLGVVTTLVGAGLCGGAGICSDDEGPGAAVAVVIITGGTMTLTGIAFLIAGAPMVRPQPEAPPSAITVEPLIGPTGGGLRVRF